MSRLIIPLGDFLKLYKLIKIFYRQSLFTFEDCKQPNTSSNKAITAANSLKKIYPLVNTKGIQMKVPMPGHPYSENGNNKNILLYF